MNYFYHNNCIICESKENEVILIKENYKYMRCKNCGLIFVNPTPILTKEEMNNLSENTWFPTLKNEFTIEHLYKYPSYERQFYALYKYVKKGKMLDIGCGAGYFLYHAKNKGFECFGVEVSEVAVNYIKKVLKINNIFLGELKDADFISNFFDAIRCCHVLEHTANPVEILKEINRIIKKGGILQLGIPNSEDFLSYIKNLYHKIRRKYKKSKYSCWVFPPVHLYGFTKNNIKLLLEKSGFKILHSFTAGYGNRTYRPFVFNTSTKTIIEETIDFFWGGIFDNGSFIYIYAKK